MTAVRGGEPAERAAAVVRTRGHINAGDPQVVLERWPIQAPGVARHVWVSRWSVPSGEVRPQRVLTYPQCNVAVLPGVGAMLHGPSKGVAQVDLTGDGWVVGVLLEPAGGPLLVPVPIGELLDRAVPIGAAPAEAITAAMVEDDWHEQVVAIAEAWLAPLAKQIDERGRLANAACRLVEEDDRITRTGQLAEAVGLSVRALERLIREYTGLTPHRLIERRRLQIAATTLFADRATELVALAAELGFSDQAHFTRRYRAALGETPDATRRAGRAAGRAVDESSA
jgi:AraC-like DNA-binding protein